MLDTRVTRRPSDLAIVRWWRSVVPASRANRRLMLLLAGLLCWVAAIFGRLIQLQVVRHDEFSKLAQQQQQKQVDIPAMRGSIFDRSGHLLAKSLPAESICVNPQRIPDAGVAADLLSGLLGLNRAKLYDQIASAKRRKVGFLWIKRKLDASEVDHVRAQKLDWVEVREDPRRQYTHGELASHVVGSMGILNDDTSERGNAGIERYLDEELAGRPGTARVYTDVKQNVYDSVVVRKPEQGSDITLSIDSNLQFVAERELDKAIESSGAKTGSIVALNPYSGDVLAMANYPRFNPNVPPAPGESRSGRSNLAIETPFEPGSVFKIVTVSAAIETNSFQPDSIVNCGGSINLGGKSFRDEHGHGAFSVADILAHSSNVGAIMVGRKVGPTDLFKYQSAFGFGKSTGIELPGESAGVLKRAEDLKRREDWIGLEDFMAMGHGLAVTSLQLALAGAAIANGGILIKPRLVLSRQAPGQPAEISAPEQGRRILDPQTAIQMRRMMEGVVLRGTGKGYANLRGYTAGGKTGTAQIYDKVAHAYSHRYNASFLGFAPLENPQIVIIVTLEGTTGGTAGYGAPVAAPVFREVAMEALRTFDVPKSVPDSTVTSSVDLLREPDPAHEPDPARQPDPGGRNVASPRNSAMRSVSSDTTPPVQGDALASAGSSASSKESLDRRHFFAPPDEGPQTAGDERPNAHVRVPSAK